MLTSHCGGGSASDLSAAHGCVLTNAVSISISAGSGELRPRCLGHGGNIHSCDGDRKSGSYCCTKTGCTFSEV